jgi:hypothetical protein
LYLQKQYELGSVRSPYGFYLLDDLGHPDMPDYALYIFLNAFHLSQQEREMIERKVKRDGTVVVWVYAAGLIGEGGISGEYMEELTGIRCGVYVDQWVLNVTVTDYEHPLTVDLPVPMRFGTDYQIGPIVYADDVGVRVLGNLVYSRGMARPGFCVKEFEEWTSIFIAAPVIPAVLLRNIARYAGVHLYSDSLDVVYANNSFVAVHTNHKSGRRVIGLRKKADVYEVFEGREVAKNAMSFVEELPARTTKLYYIGDEEFQYE